MAYMRQRRRAGTYKVSVSLVRIILGSLSEFVRPGVDDRVAIDVLNAEHDAFP
jgi:hypothetical protein